LRKKGTGPKEKAQYGASLPRRGERVPFWVVSRAEKHCTLFKGKRKLKGGKDQETGGESRRKVR